MLIKKEAEVRNIESKTSQKGNTYYSVKALINEDTEVVEMAVFEKPTFKVGDVIPLNIVLHLAGRHKVNVYKAN